VREQRHQCRPIGVSRRAEHAVVGKPRKAVGSKLRPHIADRQKPGSGADGACERAGGRRCRDDEIKRCAERGVIVEIVLQVEVVEDVNLRAVPRLEIVELRLAVAILQIDEADIPLGHDRGPVIERAEVFPARSRRDHAAPADPDIGARPEVLQALLPKRHSLRIWHEDRSIRRKPRNIVAQKAQRRTVLCIEIGRGFVLQPRAQPHLLSVVCRAGIRLYTDGRKCPAQQRGEPAIRRDNDLTVRPALISELLIT